jgi:hypothetical protein
MVILSNEDVFADGLFMGGSYFWAQRISLYRIIPIAAQILAFGLQVGGAVLQPLNGLCRAFK